MSRWHVPLVALLLILLGVSIAGYKSAAFGLPFSPEREADVWTVEARAIVRSDLWNPDKRIDPKSLPTPGQILAEMSDNTVGGEKYDREWPERARQTMW